ncbi:hypothetical protein ACH9L7_07285 [Haloferax sp. S1W]|uniref:hypothetical protein n=1 Tax=Haloferax sp. S1W TaxID=3377110 RepID=UPI0037C6E76C
MNILGYLGFVAFSVALAYSLRWLDPTAVSKLSRQFGIPRRTGWAFAIAAFLWIFLPVLVGAKLDDELWVFGAAVAGVGFFIATISVSSRDEYRLLQRVPFVDPEDVSASRGQSLVGTSGRPTPLSDGQEDEFRTPFSGRPSVHTDWLVQKRGRVGFREAWKNTAEGVKQAEFALGESGVRVTPGTHRVFIEKEHMFSLDLSENVPEPAATFLEAHPDLPNPESSDDELRIIERYVPADEPVTVVGNATQAAEPGVVRIEGAPGDELLGTHADHATTGAPEAVLIRGDAELAQYTMRKRVYWLGVAGTAMILGGQLLSFWLSSASLTNVLSVL